MKNMLVIRFSSLGDVVLTTGVIKYIKEELKDINIDVLTMTPFAAVFSDFPYIRNIYCINKGASLSALLDVLTSMPDYDGVFDLHDNLRSFFAKVVIPSPSFTYKKDTLYRRLFVKFRLCKDKLKKHVVTKYCDAFGLGLKLPTPAPEKIRPYLPCPFSERNKSARKTVGIHPFASKHAKEWPFIYELCALLLDEGLNVRVVGDGKIELPAGVEDLTGFTPLNTLIRNIADCDVFLSTDSGPMHIAIALGLPVVALFGPTTREMGFYPVFKNCSVIEDIPLKCRPCHIHGPETCPKKHFQCMLSATIEEVRTKVQERLKTNTKVS